MSSLVIRSNSMKCLWPAKVSQNGLVINFDNHPNNYPNWVPHLGTQCFQVTLLKILLLTYTITSAGVQNEKTS